MNKKTNLIWIDLEMTGLIPESDVIIEIATVVTDANLNVIDEGPGEQLSGMGAWASIQNSIRLLSMNIIIKLWDI